MSDSVRPHRRQPTRLPRPWDSPGKNTGVGYHFLLQCMKVKSEREVAQSCPTLDDPTDCSLSGSSIRGIFQARVLEWGAIAFSGERILVAINLSHSHCQAHSGSSLTKCIKLIEWKQERWDLGQKMSVDLGVISKRWGEGNGNPLQYSCLENPTDGGAWWAAIHGDTKSRTWLSDFTFPFHFHALEKEMATHSSVLA